MADLLIGIGPHSGLCETEFIGGPLDGETFRLPLDSLRVFYVVEGEKGDWKGAYIAAGRPVFLNWDNRPGEDEPYAWYAERYAGRYLRWTDALARWHPYA